MRRQLLLMLVFIVGHALAQPPAVDIYSPAENTCTDWKRSARSPELRNQYFMWFLGFVSGHNLMSTEQQVPRARIPNEKQFAAMVDEACTANPQQALSMVALRFVDTNRFPAKAQKKP